MEHIQSFKKNSECFKKISLQANVHISQRKKNQSQIPLIVLLDIFSYCVFHFFAGNNFFHK